MPASNHLAHMHDLVAIPDVRVVLDNDPPNSNILPPPDEVQFDTVIIPESLKPGTEHDTAVALLHRENALALHSENFSSIACSRQPRYRISHAGNSGLGVFATANYERGERILHERPLIVYPQMIPFHSNHPVGQQYPELDCAVERMPLENRKAFFALMNSRRQDPSRVKAIIDTNALFVGSLPGATHQYAAVCRDISRVNHSCSPNAAYHFDLHTFAFDVRAIFPISAGEQVFISYIDPSLPRPARQCALSSSYSFTCACPACALSGDALAQSETRRSLIARADADLLARNAALERWPRTPSVPDDYIRQVDKMYADLFEAERLYYEPVWEGYAARLCKAACALEDGEGARKWAALAAALNRAYTGGDRGWDAVVAAPERTDWWGLRVRTLAGHPVDVRSTSTTATVEDQG